MLYKNIPSDKGPASKSTTKKIAEGAWQTTGYPGKKVIAAEAASYGAFSYTQHNGNSAKETSCLFPF